MSSNTEIAGAFAARLERPPPLGQDAGDRELVERVLRLAANSPARARLREAASAVEPRAPLLELLFELACTSEADLRGSSLLDSAIALLSPSCMNARELGDRLPAILADAKASEAARLCAAALLLAFRDHEPPVVAFAATYVDSLLKSAECRKAFLDAVGAWQRPKPLPEAPSTRGKKRVEGSDGLRFEPYAHRRTITDAFAALGRIARRDRRLLPWLFEGAKLWSGERELALAAVRDAAPSDAELGAGLQELVRFCALEPSRERAALMRSALDAAGGDARWLTLLLTELDAQPALCAALAERLIRVKPLAADSPPELAPWRAELAGLADRAALPVVRTVAFAAAGGSEATAAAVLESMPADLAHVVAMRIVERRAFGDEVGRAAAKLRNELELDGDEPDAAADLAAVAWNCRQAARGSSTDLLPGTSLFEPYAVGDALIVPYHRIRTLVPPSSWCNDEDELGVLVISRGREGLSRVLLPMELPITPNGASGAKRHMKPELVVDGELFVTVICPFSGRGWGNESYLWSFQPTGTWRSWRRVGDELAPLSAGERPEPIGYGELLLWRDGDALGFQLDGTPYHLDDWVRDERVTQAIAAHEGALADRADQPPSPESVGWSDLSIPRPAASPELETVWAGRWGEHQVALANARGERWPELAVTIVR